jgi:uncharacterized membrane protein YkoI
MKRKAVILAGLLAALALPSMGAAQPQDSLGADWRQQQDEARQGVKRGRLVPLGQVIGMISRRTPGRVLDAGIEYFGDRPIYRVRWITTDGRRIDYMVDATTGAIMSGG